MVRRRKQMAPGTLGVFVSSRAGSRLGPLSRQKPGEEVTLVPWSAGQKASSQVVPEAGVWESRQSKV